MNGHLEIVKLLIRHNADLYCITNGDEPLDALEFAKRNKQKEVIEYLEKLIQDDK